MTIPRRSSRPTQRARRAISNSAIPLYGRALQANPNGVEAKLGLGQSYLTLGLPDEAAAMFRDVLDKRAGEQTARRGLAMAMISMGQAQLAERQLEAAVQADPRDYRTLNAYGVVLDMMGRHAEAQARYRQGIELAPDFVALRSNFGLSLAISGQPQEAIDQLVAADRQPRRRRAGAPEPRLRLRHERRPRGLPANLAQGSRRGERPAPAAILHAAPGAAGRTAQRRAQAQSKLLPAIRLERLK